MYFHSILTKNVYIMILRFQLIIKEQEVVVNTWMFQHSLKYKDQQPCVGFQ